MNCQMGCKSKEDIKHIIEECQIIKNEEKWSSSPYIKKTKENTIILHI